MIKDFNESNILNDFREVISQIYKNWWAERNGGNISLILDEEMISGYVFNEKSNRNFKLEYDCSELKNKYLLVTGSGKYYRNIANKNKTKENLGVIKISADGKGYSIVWGFEKEALPTSELPSHLLSHVARLKVNDKHRIVIHSHPTNLVALTFTEELDEKSFTKKMWTTISEASVVFPEGIGLLKWMLPGSQEIGEETAKKMAKYRSVIWAHHGIFCSGNDLDEAFGLLECIEKSAMIYINILNTNKKILNQITDKNYQEMSEHFGYEINKEILNYKGE